MPLANKIISSISITLLTQPGSSSQLSTSSYDVLDNYRDIDKNASPINLPISISEHYGHNINLNQEFLKLNYQQNLEESNYLELFSTAMFPIDTEQPEITKAKDIIIESRKDNRM